MFVGCCFVLCVVCVLLFVEYWCGLFVFIRSCLFLCGVCCCWFLVGVVVDLVLVVCCWLFGDVVVCR